MTDSAPLQPHQASGTGRRLAMFRAPLSGPNQSGGIDTIVNRSRHMGRNNPWVKASVDKALEFFDGRIDVIVNNAGVAALDTIQDMRSDVLDAVIDTVLKGHMYVVKYLVPNMIERRSGKIINITSGVTGAGTSNLSHYVAAKYALNGLIERLRGH